MIDHAPPTTHREKWEHQVVELSLRDVSDLSYWLTSWGNLGFELVSVTSRWFRPTRFYFKRRQVDA